MIKSIKEVVSHITGFKSALTAVTIFSALLYVFICTMAYIIGTFTGIEVNGQWMIDFGKTMLPIFATPLLTTFGCSMGEAYFDSKKQNANTQVQ